MTLFMSAVLALLPLLGVIWIVFYGSPTTVDGLFTSLILLTMSGIFGLNVLLEIRRRRSGVAAGPQPRLSTSGLVQRGRVESVQFFEALVGQANKSIVTLANGTGSPHTLVFAGDMRNALPVGQKVEITFRKESGHNVLVNVNYA